MKNLVRFLILHFFFLFIIPVAFGEINITIPDKDIYNLGEKIKPVVSIKEDQDYDGFFSLHIFCDNYNLQYYTIPLTLEANFRTQLIVPELPFSKSMTGICKLRSNFEATEGERIDREWSQDFLVTDKLNITIDENLEAKPGEEVFVLGEIKKYSGGILTEGEATISFRGDENKVDITSGKFKHAIYLSNYIETGKIPVLIVAKDKYGNYGDKIISLKINPIPTRIENRFETKVLNPGDNLKVRVTLYDQNDKVINGVEINIKMFDSNENLVAEKSIQNSYYFEHLIQNNQIPGSYFLLSTFENIKEQYNFKVEILRKIVMRQEGNFIHIENVGNIDYMDDLTLVLEGDDKKYLLNKEINLKPLDTISFDLSKEVPQGYYDISFPEEAIDTSVFDAQGNVAQLNKIKDVYIEDNRELIKKATSGISSITGAVVETATYIVSKPFLASIIIVLIILGTLTYYGKGFLINKIKRNKPDTEDIFEDFKYGEKK